MTTRPSNFPLGDAVSLDALDRDPYPILTELREHEPVSYVRALNLYFVTRHKDCVSILRNPENFVVGTSQSLIKDIFGTHMMTVEGAEHERHRRPHRPFFLPGMIHNQLESTIQRHTDNLIDEFEDARSVELRQALSSRLPILTMLSLFGIPTSEEAQFRSLYNDFELAVSNFTWDSAIRQRGKRSARMFHDVLQHYIDEVNDSDLGQIDSMLAALKKSTRQSQLSDDEIRHNAMIIFFGGISTVDALILNTLYALAKHPHAWQAISIDIERLPQAIDETVRWLGPVQSATRHVVGDVELRGVRLTTGDTINCMLASANRDPHVFTDPFRFDIERTDGHRHLGFAMGAHHCLGSNLARAEARIAIERLFTRLPHLRIDTERTSSPTGYEFRQPKQMYATWG